MVSEGKEARGQRKNKRFEVFWGSVADTADITCGNEGEDVFCCFGEGPELHRRRHQIMN